MDGIRTGQHRRLVHHLPRSRGGDEGCRRGQHHQQPHLVQVEIRAGDTPQVEIKLVRNSDVAAMGWHSGNNHVHGNLFADDRIKPADVLLIAQAEDLNVVNVLPTGFEPPLRRCPSAR